MFRQRLRFHCLGLSAIALSLCAALAVPAVADGPSGHDIAERFAADAERTAKKRAERVEQQRLQKFEAERQRDETDMLERARREASDRQAELERQRVAREQVEREDQERRITVEREVAERRRVEQERAEVQRRQAEAERQAADEARRVAEAQAAEERRRADGARERQAEADRVSEALRKAIENRERERQTAQQPSVAPMPPVERAAAPPPSAVIEAPIAHGAANAPGGQRFAVLMLMEPGNRGIRRHNKTADPVLCTDAGCYVSNGPTAAAHLMPHRKALGFFRTWGQRAGACQQSLTCVFRGIESAGLSLQLQPVDMRVVRHDRREAQVVDGSSDCFLAAGRLGCRRPVRGANYVMWLVPEKMAEAIGPALLEQALTDGLPESEQADLGPRRW